MSNPASSGVTLSELDLSICSALIVKARQQGRFEELMRQVHEQEQNLLAHPPLMTGSDNSGYAMTDAAKRLRGTEGDDFEVVGSYAAPATRVTVPMPSDAEGSFSPTELPPGVRSMKDWGEYLVAFGKYEGKKTYYQMYHEDTTEMISYRKYLFSNRKSGSAQLKDLVQYLDACGGKVTQGIVIPGTNIVRKK